MNKLLLLTIFFLLASCAPAATEPAPDETAETNLPNPASVYCEEQGNRLEIRTAADGSQSGVCIFPDGSECEEWAFYRDECSSPGEAQPADNAWLVYSNAELGYSFDYPPDALIIQNDDPLGGITIAGPSVDGETWPTIGVAHPGDREEYLPTQGVDLYQWLTDHNMLGETRLDDVRIAGTTAVHFRHERSPQSYAMDTYYFAVDGRLYQIVILHTGDKEDWDLYGQFLESFRFDG